MLPFHALPFAPLQAGLWVSASGRVCGELDMSRALGDADLKQAHGLPRELQAVTAQPTVMSLPLVPTTSTSYNSRNSSATAPFSTGIGHVGQPAAQAWPGQPADFAGSGVQEEPPSELPSTAPLGPGLTAPDCGPPSSSAPGTSPGISPAHNPAPTYLLLASDGLWNVLDNKQVRQDASNVSSGRSCNNARPHLFYRTVTLAGVHTLVAWVDHEALKRVASGLEGALLVLWSLVPNAPTPCMLLFAAGFLSPQVHDLVVEQLAAGVPPDAIAAQLAIESCVAERTAYDNVTVLLVLLHGREPAPPSAPAAAAAAPAPAAAVGVQGQAQVQGQGQLSAALAPMPAASLLAAAVVGGSSGSPQGPVVRVHTPPPPTRFPVSAGGAEGGQASLGPQQQRKRRQLHAVLGLDVAESLGLGTEAGHAGAEAGNVAAAEALYAAAFPSRANKRQVQLSGAQQQQQQCALGLGLDNSGAAAACTAAAPAHGPETSAGAAGRAAGLGGSCWRPSGVGWVAGSNLGAEGRMGGGRTGVESAIGVLGAEGVTGGPDAGAAGTGLDDRLLEASPLHGGDCV